MEQEQLIFDFIEGSLTPEGESELFRILSISDDLRAELKSQLAIKSAVRSDVAAFTPKAQSTMNIFNSVGLTPPPGIAPLPKSGFFTTLGTKLSSFSPFMITGTIASITTAVIIFMLYNFGAFDNILQAKYSPTEYAQTKVRHEAPVMTSEALRTQNSAMGDGLATGSMNQSETKVVYKYVYLKENSISQNEALPNTVTPNLGADNEIQFNKDLTLNRQFTQNIIRRETEKPQKFLYFVHPDGNISPLFTGEKNLQEIENFAIEFRGTIYNYGKDVRIDPSKSELSNIGLTVTYALSDEFKIGVDYHRENFYQSFSGIEEGVMYNYHQNPNIETWGVLLRYNPDLLRYDFVLPFVQVNGGSSEIGPVLRVSTGLELLSGDKFKILLGYGWSHLWYNHNNKWFDSTKDGFQIGFGLKF